MLSILIPVYQFDVCVFVEELLKQGRDLGILFEIRVYDDASPPGFDKKNEVLQQNPEVVYRKLAKNMGRSRIRNTLARDAVYDYLLFLDGDSEVVRPDFLQQYLNNADKKTVWHGGTAYSPQPPSDTKAYLRWWYGKNREVRSPLRRTAQGYHGFTSNNFFLPKSIFLAIQFDESIRGYGHEDTLFGYALQTANVPLRYIDNPLGHIGLESAEVFLKKTEEGVRNLHRLYEQGQPVQTTLLDWYLKLKKWKLTGLVSTFGQAFLPLIRRNLLSSSPSLRLMDIYKLIVICQG